MRTMQVYYSGVLLVQLRTGGYEEHQQRREITGEKPYKHSYILITGGQLL